MIKDNSVILFQGDSITDAGRTFGPTEDDLGNGYVIKVKKYLDIFCKDKNITVINKGISGHRTIELKNRWQKDCIDLKPDYLSILIGINDTWRRYDSNDETTALQYEENFREILSKARDELHCEFIILEPFLIHEHAAFPNMREDLDPKIQVARKLAKEFNAIYIPFDGMFAELCSQSDSAEWSQDGVHPTDKGHAFMATEWIKRVL